MNKIIFPLLLVVISSCSEFLEIDPPRTDLVSATVFSNDKTAQAAVMDIYYQMRRSGFASGDLGSITYLTALSSDEVLNYNTGAGQGQTFKQFNDNTLHFSNVQVATLWTDLYKCIYKANAVLEGISSSPVSETLKAQLEGEALFVRAFCNFYLVNLWGDVPLVMTTDYRINATIPRTPTQQVFKQIVDDLVTAKSLLPGDYSLANGERVRPNNVAATALLARTYLYIGEWENAVTFSTNVIDNPAYGLEPDPKNVFLKNSKEAIWQLHSNIPTNDVFTFYFTKTPTNGALREDFIQNFEPGDLRQSDWIRMITNGVSTYYFPYKYKGIDYSNIKEYSTVLRLGEQYLIRAEARAHLNDTAGAQADLNAIRHRANLGDTPANDQTDLLLAIEQERNTELFSEWGHRWFDLKRTNRVDAVLGKIKPEWTPTGALYPIPEIQILKDPSMRSSQNPGY